MPRINFSAGPGEVPACVTSQTAQALREVPEVGLPLLGISHRSEWFGNVVDEAKEHLSALLKLPSNYHILFMQGGSTLQFSTVAALFMRGKDVCADYLHTGYWSGKAIPEAIKEGRVRVLYDGTNDGFSRLPADQELDFSPDAAYFHYISNETVEGLQFHRTLGLPGVRRVCDMSSDFLSRPFDVSEFDIIYAHAQKNLGPSGVTVVLVRDEILAEIPAGLPSMMDYRPHVAKNSIYNTPPTFAIYVVMLVLRWLRSEIGGLKNMNAINCAKAARLYQTIDQNPHFYRGRAAKNDRSLMNVSFNLPDAALEHQFFCDSEAAGFSGLQGHHSCGGLRASLYNAVSLASVETLCEFMSDFAAKHVGKAQFEASA